jgi:GNAT superfamily N-acetyltransferase
MESTRPFRSIASVGDAVGAEIERQFETIFRSCLKGPNAVVEEKFARLLTGEAHPLANFAVVSDFDDLETTKRAIEPLASCGLPAAVLYPGRDVAPSIRAHLESAGFANHGEMPAMAVDIDGLAETALPEGYELVRMGDGAEGDVWAEILSVGYELPLVAAKLFAPNALCADMAPDAEIQFFAVLKGEVPVATSLLYLKDGLAGIYCVATIPEERGKGLGAHATAEPLRLAKRVGYGVGVLQSSPMGYPVYQRLGFADFGGVPMYMRMPSG